MNFSFRTRVRAQQTNPVPRRTATATAVNVDISTAQDTVKPQRYHAKIKLVSWSFSHLRYLSIEVFQDLVEAISYQFKILNFEVETSKRLDRV